MNQYLLSEDVFIALYKAMTLEGNPETKNTITIPPNCQFVKEEKPIFEIKGCYGGPLHIKIWANGRIEGIEGAIINRIPEMIAKLKQNNS